MVSSGTVPSIDDALNAVQELATFIERVEACGIANDDAATFLVVLADYGRRWEVMAQCVVPTRASFVMRIADDRPLKIGGVRASTTTSLVIADAVSNHVVVRAADRNVRLGKVQALDAAGSRIAKSYFAGVRDSRESFSLYASDEDRDYQITLRVPLRLSGEVRWTSAAIVLLLFGTTALLATVRPMTSTIAQILVIPTTFGASLLLTRETSSLATRLKRSLTNATLLGIVALWSVLAWLLVRGTIDDGPSPVQTCQTAGVQSAPQRRALSCEGGSDG